MHSHAPPHDDLIIQDEDFANNIIILLEKLFSNLQGYYLDRHLGGLMDMLEIQSVK